MERRLSDARAGRSQSRVVRPTSSIITGLFADSFWSAVAAAPPDSAPNTDTRSDVTVAGTHLTVAGELDGFALDQPAGAVIAHASLKLYDEPVRRGLNRRLLSHRVC